MESPRHSKDLIKQPQSTSDPEIKTPFANSSSPLLIQDPPAASNNRITTKLLVIAPLALHFLGSLAITFALIYGLDGRHFHLDRQPRVKLADGAFQSGQLGRNNILQSDITTIVSIALVLLRWITTAWAGPLCWRVVFLLAGNNGLRRRDISWATNYGILPGATHFRHARNMILGLVLAFTLVSYSGSPILTGSISWIPGGSTLELAAHPLINITGPAIPAPNLESGGGVLQPTFSTDLVINFNTAWGQTAEDHVFKRVVPSIAELNINSTVENVLVPFFSVSDITWFPNTTAEDRIFPNLEAWKANPRYSDSFQAYIDQLGQPGAVGLVIDLNTTYYEHSSNPSLAFLVNVARRKLGYYEPCDSTTTFLPNDTSVPSYRLHHHLFSGSRIFLEGCFAYANLTYFAGFGTCRSCRVGTYSTVQNDTELEGINTSGSAEFAIENMLKYLPTLTPIKGSLPDPTKGIDTYLTATLVRSYSALWTTWNDGYDLGTLIPANSKYKPAFPTLRAEVDRARVGAWMALQLAVTLAGLVFLWLQVGSKHLLISDTSMVAFDIDSTEVPKPNSSDQSEPRELLKLEPKEDGWKVVVASGRSSRVLD